ncbi:hypothetical protein [Dyadobacter fanqingshengii]|uniref:Uncharacterized protein n=1 Tax=Dyadobacter fanqingshengii TaxID=2906443 RepID=A0A9X1PEP9_9BACT|nr:hypothetical protein [Dyadobacter fanqingshengii]MCF0043631.1 hypothetical protein [Dyadobacter fanqingshengii]USJ34753.1 hypothetical protein NFI81_18820 [Dyadobacter fanqingshengii]
MFDGAKHISLSMETDIIMNNPMLSFSGRYDLNSGEVATGLKSSAYYKGWQFTAYRLGEKWHRVAANGSYHKFSNNGRHNHNDFTRIRLAQVIDQLRIELNFNPKKEILNGIEFGVNIILDFPVKIVLDSLLTYKGISFERPIDNPNYYQCKTKEFILKLYDKGAQYKLNMHVMRFEIKVISMDFLRKKGINIRFLSDLIDEANYSKIENLMLDYFDIILFIDLNVNPRELTGKHKDLYLQGFNKQYWRRPNKKDFQTVTMYERKRKELKREEDMFRALFTPSFIPELHHLIRSKWRALTLCSAEQTKIVDQIIACW